MAVPFHHGFDDEDLERQAEAMAASAIGNAHPSEKFLAVKGQILQRLRKQRDEKLAAPPTPVQQSVAVAAAAPAPPPPPPPPDEKIGVVIIVSGGAIAGLNGKYLQQSSTHNCRPCWRHVEDPFVMFYSSQKQKWYISNDFEDTGFVFVDSDAMMPPPGVWSKGATITMAFDGMPPSTTDQSLKVDGVELCGDEPWFADDGARQRLRDSVAEGHREQKIIVGPASAEVSRICPPDGREVMPGAVLRLGGALIGGYNESDIAYAYRQLSRALHPDKNPDIPAASAAFLRLSTASDELRQALNDQRLVLHTIVAAMDGNVTPDMLDRPQEALFAEACRLLMAVCSITGEGWLPEQVQKRIYQAFEQSNTFHRCLPDALITDWFSNSRLLDLYGGALIRTAYDCAPKRLRAQFLCILNRVLLAEATRSDGCVRASWSQIFDMFPELALWREFRDRIQVRVWEKKSKWDEKERSRSRSRDRSPDPRKRIEGDPATGQRAAPWAVKWRKGLAVILPSGLDGAVSTLDPDVKKLAISMWKDVVAWAGDGERSLGLFKSDIHMPQRGLAPDAPPAEWCFIPMSDLLLVIGQGLVGMTAEGVYAANRRGHERKSLAKFYKKTTD